MSESESRDPVRFFLTGTSAFRGTSAPFESARFVQFHQAAIAGDISGEDEGELAFKCCERRDTRSDNLGGRLTLGAATAILLKPGPLPAAVRGAACSEPACGASGFKSNGYFHAWYFRTRERRLLRGIRSFPRRPS
jgi:hypothetical protein